MKRPPKHLSPESKLLWKALQMEYSLDDAAGMAILQAALESLDIQQLALKSIKEKGILVTDKDGNQRKNPALQTEKESKALFYQGIKALNLDLEPLQTTIGRPPGRR
jgi:phage terminase small subunit